MFSNNRLRDKDFYYQEISTTDINATFTLNEDNTHHNAVVLRRKVGENIVIINGQGDALLCQIINISKRFCEVKVLAKEFQAHRPYQLYLGIGLTKNKSRNEWLIEKSVEIGIDGIIGLDTDHSECEDINFQRTENIITAAMIQSRTWHKPLFKFGISIQEAIEEFKQRHPQGQILIAHCTEDQKHHLFTHIQAQQDTLILIGPEGDFSNDEIEYALSQGVQAISLGPKRLRTETAALYAITIFNAVNYE